MVKRKASIEEIIEAYERLGSVWTAGEQLGLSGQTVHRRLKKHGYDTSRKFTAEEREVIKSYYEQTPESEFDLKAFSRSLNRPTTSVCSIAKDMGLTRMGRRLNDAYLAKTKEAHQGKWTRNPHPKGFSGSNHTPEALEAISASSRASWIIMKETGTGNMSPENRQRMSDYMTFVRTPLPPSKGYSRGKAGRRDDLGGLYVRSKWEANYARYLNWLVSLGQIERWEYEADTFWFEKIKRGVRSYKPDFKVWENGKIHYDEIKGYMDDKSATKIKRMRIYHPHVDLRVVDEKAYKAIASSVARLIPGWE